MDYNLASCDQVFNFLVLYRPMRGGEPQPGLITEGAAEKVLSREGAASKPSTTSTDNSVKEVATEQGAADKEVGFIVSLAYLGSQSTYIRRVQSCV